MLSTIRLVLENINNNFADASAKIKRGGIKMLANKVKDFKTTINDIVSKIEETQLAIFQSANANVMDFIFILEK